MPNVTFHGEQVLTYPNYTDLATGQALTATPGETYDIQAVSGADIPTDGRFTENLSVETKKSAKAISPNPDALPVDGDSPTT